jgi:DNA-binding CsgD family transcriptional regulator
VLIGRGSECELIERLLDEARGGSSRLLVLEGEPGIGKSALLQYAAAQASGMLVLNVRGVESEADIAFAGLLELVRPALQVLDRIPPRQSAALRGALALGPAERADRFLIGAATLSLLAGCAEESPLLVLVDDAQWLDRSSADALAFAMRRLVADPIAAFLALRTGEPCAFDSSALPRLSIGGLEEEAARSLLVTHAGRPIPHDTADWLFQATGGNPLALVELAVDAPRLRADLFDRPLAVGPRVQQAFLRQIERLPDELRRVLLIAAASDSGDIKPILLALERDGIPERAVEAVELAGLLRVRNGSLEFRHPLVRSAAYQAAPQLARREAHRQLAGVLTGTRDVDRRAWHLASAALGPDEQVAVTLEEAGQRALERSAYAAAASAYERAAQLTSDEEECARRLLAAADAAWLSGDVERARALLGEARQRAHEPGLRALVERLRGRIAMRTEPVLVSAEIFKAAARSIQHVDPAMAATLLAESATDAVFYSGSAKTMMEDAQAAWDLALIAGQEEATFFAGMALSQALMINGRGAEGAELMRKCVSMMDVSEALWRNPRLVVWSARGRLFLREGTTGADLMKRTTDAARDQGVMGMLPVALNQLALDSAASDRWADALTQYVEAIRLSRELEQVSELCANLAGLGRLEARLGRADECRAHFAEALQLADRFGLGLFRTWIYQGLTVLELGLGHPDEAIGHAETLEAVLDELGFDDVDLSPTPEQVEAWLRLGKVEAARPACVVYARRAAVKGLPWAMARAERCLGLIADDVTGAAHFTRALELHEHNADSFESARTHLCYGERLRRARHRVEARHEIRIAFETFERLAADPWAERARIELLATGETVQRREVRSVEALTPQEFQIAQMLAGGATTRETAAALYLSPKTVEYHLRSVYGKLGVHTRTELADTFSKETLRAAVPSN